MVMGLTTRGRQVEWTYKDTSSLVDAIFVKIDVIVIDGPRHTFPTQVCRASGSTVALLVEELIGLTT